VTGKDKTTLETLCFFFNMTTCRRVEMKPYFAALCSALKLLLAAALLVLVSDFAGAEVASIYGGSDGLCGRPTANGERLNCAELTAAHRTLAFGTRVRVCRSGCVTVRINDRGPWVRGRHIDLSPAAARAIGLSQTGRVTMNTLNGAPNAVTVANIDEQSPLSEAPSAIGNAVQKRESLLPRDQKTDNHTQEQRPDVATRDAKLEDSLPAQLPNSMPRKQTSHVLHDATTPKFYLRRSKPTQFWSLWKAFLLGRS
jgi:peptidoglycan lytic transglycosylase